MKLYMKVITKCDECPNRICSIFGSQCAMLCGEPLDDITVLHYACPLPEVTNMGYDMDSGEPITDATDEEYNVIDIN